jgi:hypothetical protein
MVGKVQCGLLKEGRAGKGHVNRTLVGEYRNRYYLSSEKLRSIESLGRSEAHHFCPLTGDTKANTANSPVTATL